VKESDRVIFYDTILVLGLEKTRKPPKTGDIQLSTDYSIPEHEAAIITSTREVG
jgi:hypothetical protein